MITKQYKIVMSVPLGKRYGTLAFTENNGAIKGTMSLFGKTEPVEGTLSNDGKVELSGIFCTLIRNIPFKAVGTVAENKISLNVQGQRSHFRINGTKA